MIYSFHIDQIFCLSHGLNIAEGGVYDYCSRLPTWAETVIIDGQTWYFSSRNKAVQEISLITEKPDTIYRHFKKLESLDLIFYKKFEGKDLIKLNPKFSKNWHRKNSEKNPNPLGKKSEHSEKNPNPLGKFSENNAENFPTYKYTSTNKKIRDKRETEGALSNENNNSQNPLKNGFEKKEKGSEQKERKEPIRDILLRLGDDTPENRMKAALVLNDYAQTEDFLNSWSVYADRYPKAVPAETLRTWATVGNWQDVKRFRINLVLGGQWIANNHKDNLKNESTNRNIRKGHDLSSDRRSTVERLLD